MRNNALTLFVWITGELNSARRHNRSKRQSGRMPLIDTRNTPFKNEENEDLQNSRHVHLFHSTSLGCLEKSNATPRGQRNIIPRKAQSNRSLQLPRQTRPKKKRQGDLNKASFVKYTFGACHAGKISLGKSMSGRIKLLYIPISIKPT